MGACYPKKILTTSLSSDECDLKVTTAANQQKIKNLMHQKSPSGYAQENYKIETIEVNVIQVRYEYMKDYDLGDTCAVYIDDLEQMYHARIEQVQETHKKQYGKY